jgi:DNA-binding NtrC family response regulator
VRAVDVKANRHHAAMQGRHAASGSLLTGASPLMQHLYDQISCVAPTNATVLLLGESGTGKELAAQTIHDLSSWSAVGHFTVNCGAISPQLAESELVWS